MSLLLSPTLRWCQHRPVVAASQKPSSSKAGPPTRPAGSSSNPYSKSKQKSQASNSNKTLSDEVPSPSKKKRTAPPAPQRSPQPRSASTSQLGCPHFDSCAGCSLENGIHNPPLYLEAVDFFSQRGLTHFPAVLNALHGWRCRAKLAVRGTAGKPVIGLYQEGSHNVVAIPNCVIHHPRINAAAKLIHQVHLTDFAK